MRFSTRAAAATIMILLCAAAAAKGKKMRHPVGFSFELPDKWKWEQASDGGVLLPPGVVVDPDKEDNPEVYSINGSYRDTHSERAYIDGLKADFKASKIEIDRGGDLESITSPGLAGVVYTFDYTHPRHQAPYRMRVFAMTPGGKLLMLIASGQRAKLDSRDKPLREVAKSLAWK
ncbi:MAG: hypothetical protein FJW39_08250 [Acidobacteria bacterium]|nr:hypothetical protein [Acidobacteriota bacterium]